LSITPRLGEKTILQEARRDKRMISKVLLEILACPQCKGPLQLQNEDGLLCEKCSLLYEIRDDIPIMLIDQARKIEKSDK